MVNQQRPKTALRPQQRIAPHTEKGKTKDNFEIWPRNGMAEKKKERGRKKAGSPSVWEGQKVKMPKTA